MLGEYSFIMVIAGILLVGAMSPGPSFLVVARNALVQSRANGVFTALGTGLGVAFFAIIASYGVTSLLKTVPNAYVVLKAIGGMYLLFLAWKVWSGASQPLDIDASSSEQGNGLLKSFLAGLLTQISNPKTALVIAGIFAAFVPQSPPANTAIYVAIVAFVIDFSWYAIVAIGLSSSSSRRVYQRAKPIFDRTAALFLGFVGVKLLTSKLDL